MIFERNQTKKSQLYLKVKIFSIKAILVYRLRKEETKVNKKKITEKIKREKILVRNLTMKRIKRERNFRKILILN